MAGIVVIFDFDKTIIDIDSDNWVVDELGATDLFNQLLPTMPWNSLMDRMMKQLHVQGKTIKEIEEELKRVPIHPRVLPAIKTVHSLGCDLRVVSDANHFFIERILNHLGIRDCFTEINTNPSNVDEEGKLRIFPFHDFRLSSHGCNLCPPNMCKDKIVEMIRASLTKDKQKRIFYLGDGSGDFCPMLKLQEVDYAMPRKNFPVWELILKNPTLIRAKVQEWTDGDELELVLLNLIKIITIQDSVKSLSVDYKFENTPMTVHEPLKPTLPVNQ